MWKACCAGLALLLCCASQAEAHFGMIIPSSSSVMEKKDAALKLELSFSHPMEKCHFIRFAAYVATERVLLVRLYPEQGSEFRIPQLRGGGKLYLCCSRDGLFEVKI